MTLIKSLLLGSAAGIVAVASAQAADLPTKKAAPVEYVKVCNVGGITGWTLPGSDTCVKFSGYITAQFEGGNLNTQYNFGSIAARAQRPGGAASPHDGTVVTSLARDCYCASPRRAFPFTTRRSASACSLRPAGRRITRPSIE